MYCNSYRCRKCGDSLWKDAWMLYRHERTCTGDVRRVYHGGVYHSTPSVFERLDDENIRVAESLRYYSYRATFDFECWFDTEQLPSDSDKVHWVARHVPLSVSVASNVPGHEPFPVRVHGPTGETRRHRTSVETGLFQSTEERRYFRRGLCQLSRGLARQLHDDFARLSRLVQQQGRGSLSAGHRQTVCLLRTTWHRHVQARHQLTWSDLALPVQRPSREDLLYHLQREE